MVWNKIKDMHNKFKRNCRISRYNNLYNELTECRDKKKTIEDEKDLIIKVRSYFDVKLKDISDTRYEKKILKLDLNRMSKSNIATFLSIFYAVLIAIFVSYVSTFITYFYQVNSYDFQLILNGTNDVSSKSNKSQTDVKKKIENVKGYINDFKNQTKIILDIYSFSKNNPYLLLGVIIFVGIFLHYLIDKHNNWKYDTMNTFLSLCINELEEKEIEQENELKYKLNAQNNLEPNKDDINIDLNKYINMIDITKIIEAEKYDYIQQFIKNTRHLKKNMIRINNLDREEIDIDESKIQNQEMLYDKKIYKIKYLKHNKKIYIFNIENFNGDAISKDTIEYIEILHIFRESNFLENIITIDLN